jgi:hypothetical protein
LIAGWIAARITVGWKEWNDSDDPKKGGHDKKREEKKLLMRFNIFMSATGGLLVMAFLMANRYVYGDGPDTTTPPVVVQVHHDPAPTVDTVYVIGATSGGGGYPPGVQPCDSGKAGDRAWYALAERFVEQQRRQDSLLMVLQTTGGPQRPPAPPPQPLRWGWFAFWVGLLGLGILLIVLPKRPPRTP